MEGDPTDNPWDFLLMLEGALIPAAAVVRRYGIAEFARASFPFTVRAVAAGFDSPAAKDEADSRGEIWLPLWTSPTNVGDLRQLFGEGRAEISGRRARDGVDFSRAVASLHLSGDFRLLTARTSTYFGKSIRGLIVSAALLVTRTHRRDSAQCFA
jgi:CRISPR-associated protein Csx17